MATESGVSETPIRTSIEMTESALYHPADGADVSSPPASGRGLPEIPLLEVGPDFGYETLERELARAHQLLDSATARVPRSALKTLDAVSRRWLVRWSNRHLGEIDRIARRLDRPGAYFLSVNYEWGCTCRVAPSPDGTTARLVRVLDWKTEGLGRYVLAARVKGAAGPFTTLTWPGYTGVLQAVAPGRFAAALNQAPMRKSVGYYYLDWAASRPRVWSMPHDTPAHLLRHVFETAENFDDARRMLTSTPISSAAIFSLAGLAPGETVVIERRETDANVHRGAQVAANHWQAFGWHGHARGEDSGGRAGRGGGVSTEFYPSFPWLTAPTLTDNTRRAMAAGATSGRGVAQGFEARRAATAPLSIG